jgi:CheY-like chemotaxis protein
MRTAGYRVAIHPSGADFLESLQHCRPAYVITDLFTPHMDSSETLVALKGDVITEFGNFTRGVAMRVTPTMRPR